MKRNLLLSGILCGTLAMAQSEYEVSALGGIVFPDSDTELENQTVFGAALQYNGFDFFFNPELMVLQSTETEFKSHPDGYPDVYGGSTFVNRVLLNGVHDFFYSDWFVPYVKLGVGYESFHDSHYFGNNDGAFADAAVGMKLHLSDAFALKLEGLAMHKFLNEGEDEDSLNYRNNFGIIGGLTYVFGDEVGKAEPAPVQEAEPAPAPAAAAAVVAAPADSDNDGVIDDKDKCPNTPEGAEVDENGCIPDSDNDGITDDKDKCPNSVLGYSVDENGCEIAPKITHTFVFGSAAISASKAGEYKAYGDFVKRNDYSVKVIGHTDNTGPAAYNQKLSEKRAEKVAEIIKERGVPADKIQTEGKGETAPLMSNDTKAGRAANRRVELITNP